MSAPVTRVYEAERKLAPSSPYGRHASGEKTKEVYEGFHSSRSVLCQLS